MQLLSRKGFLSGLGFSAMGLWLWACGNKVKEKYLYFSDSELEIMQVWSDSVLPVQEKGMPSADEAEVVRRLDEEFYFVSEEIQEEFHLAITALQYSPFFYGYFSRFSKMHRDDRIRFLKQTESTDSDTMRAVVGNLKLVTFLAYYGHKSTWQEIGFDGPFANPSEKWSESRIYYKKTISGS